MGGPPPRPGRQPHTGSGSTHTRNAMGQMAVDNLAAFFAGKPLLWHIVHRLKASHLIEDIAIATTTGM